MKDATVGDLSRVPAQVLPAVPMATPVDPDAAGGSRRLYSS